MDFKILVISILFRNLNAIDAQDTITTNLSSAGNYSTKGGAQPKTPPPPPSTAEKTTFESRVDESVLPRQPAWMTLKLNQQGIGMTWAPPAGGSPPLKIRGYIVGYGVGIPDVFRQIVTEEFRAYVIKNIRPSSEYVVSLRAFNNVGEGVPIYETITTGSEQNIFESSVSLIPPLGLKAIVLSSSSIWLSWVYAPDTNPKSTKTSNENKVYVVRWTTEGKRSYTLQNVSSRSLLVEDLRPNTEYEFSVKVVKQRVASPWSLCTLNRTFESALTSYPRDLTVTSSDDDWVLVSWQPPKNHGGQITGYQLSYTSSLSDNPAWVDQNLRGDRLSASIRSQPSPLVIKIRAKNNAGYGPYSPVSLYRGKPNYEIVDLGDLYKNSASLSNVAPWVLWLTISIVSLILLAVVIFVVALLKCRTAKGGDKDKKEDCLLASGTRQVLPPDVCGLVEMKEFRQLNAYLEGDGASSNYLEYRPVGCQKRSSEHSFEFNKPLLMAGKSKQLHFQSSDSMSNGSNRLGHSSTTHSPIKISKYLTQTSPTLKTKYLPAGGGWVGEASAPYFLKNVNFSDYEIGSNSEKSRSVDYGDKADNSTDLQQEMSHLDKLMLNLNNAATGGDI